VRNIRHPLMTAQEGLLGDLQTRAVFSLSLRYPPGSMWAVALSRSATSSATSSFRSFSPAPDCYGPAWRSFTAADAGAQHAPARRAVCPKMPCMVPGEISDAAATSGTSRTAGPEEQGARHGWRAPGIRRNLNDVVNGFLRVG
jgi:hypothetical protein